MNSIDNLTYVSDSKIHGRGLFARAGIAKGDKIGQIQGIACSKDGPYVLWISETEGIEVLGSLKFINHADKPNACYYDDLTVIALRRIKPGEEITHNYESADW